MDYVRIMDRQSQFRGQRFRVRDRKPGGAVQVVITGTVFMWFEPGEYQAA